MAHYDSYLLRIWRSAGDLGPQWAIRLEHMQQGEQHNFSSLEALLSHLRAVAGPLEGTQAGTAGDVTSGAEPCDASWLGTIKGDPL